MSEKVPSELWARIFSFACLGDSATSSAISLVSRYFFEASLPVRYRCVDIDGRKKLRRFAQALDRSESCRRHVVHLCIFSHTKRHYAELQSLQSRAAQTRHFELTGKAHQAFIRQVLRVLVQVAPNLRTLTLNWENGSLPAPFTRTEFPALVEMTLIGSYYLFPPPMNYRVSGVGSLASTKSACGTVSTMPVLKRLHLATYNDHLPALLKVAPAALTHLRLSLDPFRARKCNALESVLNKYSNRTEAISKHIYGLIYDFTSFGTLKRLREENTIRPDWIVLENTELIYLWEDAREDWKERINGGDGCWRNTA